MIIRALRGGQSYIETKFCVLLQLSWYQSKQDCFSKDINCNHYGNQLLRIYLNYIVYICIYIIKC